MSRSRSRDGHRDKNSRKSDGARNHSKQDRSSSSSGSDSDVKSQKRSRSKDVRLEKRSRHYEKDDRSKDKKKMSQSRNQNRYSTDDERDRSRDARHSRNGNKKTTRKDENSRSRSRDNTNGRYKYKDRRRSSRSRSRDRGRSDDARKSNNYRSKGKHDSRRSASFDTANAKWGTQDADESSKPEGSKDKPNFGLSGKLTEERNTYKGIVIKYSEPPEARKPKRRWRLYPFKGEKALQTLYIHRESAYLIGRERKVVDLPVDHPSCSKQHAVLQYRLVPFTRDDGSAGKRVRPYLIDLESANGTFINNKKIDPRKYVELLERDVIKFGFSSREYVLLHENSKDEAMDDDVKQEEEVKVKTKQEDE